MDQQKTRFPLVWILLALKVCLIYHWIPSVHGLLSIALYISPFSMYKIIPTTSSSNGLGTETVFPFEWFHLPKVLLAHFQNGSTNAHLWWYEVQKWNGMVPNAEVLQPRSGAAQCQGQVWWEALVFMCFTPFNALQCTYKGDEHRGQNLLKVCIKSVTEENNCKTIVWEARPIFSLWGQRKY